MKSLIVVVLVLTLCSLSFIAGRNSSSVRKIGNYSSSHTNELDHLQEELSGQK